MNKEILKEIQKIGKFLKNKLKGKVIELRIFGSRFVGNFNFWSDLDILVIVKNKDEKIESLIYKAFKKIEDKFLLPVHLVIRSLEEWEKELKFKTPFSQEIIEKSYKL